MDVLTRAPLTAPGPVPEPATGPTEEAPGEAPAGGRAELRLWLRLLTATTLIETEVRTRLRRRFGTTLPRFDLMAQLDKAPEGLSMGELSRRMMVSNGNVTGLTERLVAEGLVDRLPSPVDRRTWFVRLTPAGTASFRRMAAEHAGWIAELLGDLDADEVADLMRLLARAKASARRAGAGGAP